MSSCHHFIVSSCHHVIRSSGHLVIIASFHHLCHPGIISSCQLWQLVAAFNNVGQQLGTFVNFCLLLTTFGNVWQLLMTFGHAWQQLPTSANFQQHHPMFFNFWQNLAIFYKCWQHSRMFGNFLQCWAKFYNVCQFWQLCHFWQILATFGNFCHPFVLSSCRLVNQIPVILSSCHIVILSFLSFCPFVIFSVWQPFNLSACHSASLWASQLVSFSACASWSLRACFKY